LNRKALISSIMVALIIGAAIGGITFLVYLEGTHGISVHLYYLPIIFAAFYFGDYGAIIAALLAAAACGSWMPGSWAWDPNTETTVGQSQTFVEVIVRALMFFVVGIASSWTSTQLRRRIAEGRTLYQVAQNITSTLRIQRVLELIAKHAVEVMDAKACSIRLLDHETGELKLAATRGLDEKYWQKGPVSVAGSELDRQVLTGEALQIRNVCADPRFQYQEAAKEAGLSSVLCVPLATQQRIHGVMRIYSKRPRRFKQQETDLLTAFANQAAVAIENAGLYEDLRISYYDTVRALTRAIEAKDMEVYSHSERVADLADEMAQELGMNGEQRELLRFGATLHDIGKIGVSEQGMSARSDGDADHVFYTMHPLIGRTILAPVQFLQPILPAVVHHHENWDGTGFPEGLAGKDIPLEARIIAICDAYDRLTNPEDNFSRRLSPQEAMAQIVSNAGTRFDPDLVVVFRRCRLRTFQEQASKNEGEGTIAQAKEG